MAQRNFIPFLICASVFITLFCGVGLEYMFRARVDKMRHENSIVEEKMRASAIPGLIYERVPSSEDVNSHGFRDVEHSLTKAPDAYRIALVGDSVPLGHGVARHETFGRILQERCPTHEGKRTEVVLIAETGYTMEQELILFKERGRQFKPDLLLWSYCLNDPANALYHSHTNMFVQYFYEPASYLWFELKRKAFLLYQRVLEHGVELEFHKILDHAYWEETVQSFHKLQALARENNLPVVLFIVPVLDVKSLASDPEYVFDTRTYYLMYIHDKIKTLAESLGFTVIDGAEALQGEKLKELVQHPQDVWHPTPKGHRLLGELLARKLCALENEGLTNPAQN